MSSHNAGKQDRWLIFQNDRLIFIKHDSMTQLPYAENIFYLEPYLNRIHLLTDHHDTPIYCAELQPSLALHSSMITLSLRSALDHLGDDWYHIATKAFTIINWDRNHQFCGRCGEQTQHKTGSYERFCERCGLNFYPRISPSVIVLIHRGDNVLMARGYHFQPGAYGLIAGFVEAGESLEQAIHREVYEETRLKIKNLRYFGSQVWPFPDSLMSGFFAEYDSGELNIDNDEIEDAGWYRYDNLPGRPSTNISLASKMLNHFIAEQQKQT